MVFKNNLSREEKKEQLRRTLQVNGKEFTEESLEEMYRLSELMMSILGGTFKCSDCSKDNQFYDIQSK